MQIRIKYYPDVRLARNDINPLILNKFTFENLDKMQQTSDAFLFFLLKIVEKVGNCCIIWAKTLINLNHNAKSSSKSTIDNDFKIDSENENSIMELRNNMLCTVDIRPGQGLATQNKNLISVMTVCLLSYSFNKRANLFRIINRQFLYINHIRNKAIKSLYQMSLVVSNEIIHRFFLINT